jgi:hypothetical protein
MHTYEMRPRNDKRGVNLISGALSFGCLWYAEPDAIANGINHAKYYSRSRDCVICAHDDAGTVIEKHKQVGGQELTWS